MKEREQNDGKTGNDICDCFWQVAPPEQSLSGAGVNWLPAFESGPTPGAGRMAPVFGKDHGQAVLICEISVGGMLDRGPGTQFTGPGPEGPQSSANATRPRPRCFARAVRSVWQGRSGTGAPGPGVPTNLLPQGLRRLVARKSGA